MLRTVPGPSPWYLDGLKVASSQGQLEWRPAGTTSPFAGKSCLTAANGDVVAISDFQCYVRPLANDRMLAWYEANDGDRSTLRLAVFELGHLSPFKDIPAALAELGGARRLITAAAPIDAFEISRTLADGSHTVSIPSSFSGLGEILMLGASTADGRRENSFNEMHQRLWILDCTTGKLGVVPQDWFNRGPYDFGYQWVTRIARLPGSSEIVGEGIRLGVFLLDPSHREIAEWLAEDIFYHPEAPFEPASPDG